MNNDRKQLIRLASKMPVGDEGRRVLLAELQKQAMPAETQQQMRDFVEMAEDNRSPVTSSEESQWTRKGEPNSCPICGAYADGPYDFKNERGRFDCGNCGTEYYAALKLIPTGINGVSYGHGGSFREQPAKGSIMYDDID